MNYGIRIDKIFEKDGRKYFFKDNTKYYIYEDIKDDKYVDNLFNITNNMYYNNIDVNTFILNKENKFITKKGNNKICILKVNDLEKDLTLQYLKKFEFYNNNLNDYDIVEEWKNTIDNLEKEMIEYNKEFQIIQNSINYFIGMGENAISLLNTYKNEITINNNSIGHKIEKNCININNPFNFIKTNRMYNLANYIKFNFYNGTINYDIIDSIINNINNEYESVFLFSNLIYPSFYFNIVKEVLRKNRNEEYLNIFIKNRKRYNDLLVYIQNRFKNVKEIALISWISE